MQHGESMPARCNLDTACSCTQDGAVACSAMSLQHTVTCNIHCCTVEQLTGKTAASRPQLRESFDGVSYCFRYNNDLGTPKSLLQVRDCWKCTSRPSHVHVSGAVATVAQAHMRQGRLFCPC